MMTYIRLALKNLSRQRKRSNLLGMAITFGVLIITISNGLAMSLLVNASRNFSEFMAGHIFLTRQEKLPSGRTLEVFRNDVPLEEMIKSEKLPVKSLTKRTSLSATLIAEQESIVVKLEGLDWQKETDLEKVLHLKKGAWAAIKQTSNSLLLTESSAKRLQVDLNDAVLAKVETATGQINVVEFVVKGITIDSGFLAAMSVYADIRAVNEAYNVPADAYNSLNLFLDDYRQQETVAARLHKLFNEKKMVLVDYKAATDYLDAAKDLDWSGERYRMVTLNEMLGSVKSLMDGLNIVSFVILGILLLIITVGITNTYRMILYERVREIGTMRSLGVQKDRVRQLFYLEALFLCLGSSLLGMLTGFLILWGVSFINFGPENPVSIFLQNGHLSFEINSTLTLLSIAFVMVAILVAVGFPARKAARLKPAEALQMHY